MKNRAFWDTATCSFVIGDEFITLIMESARTSETSAYYPAQYPKRL
jgi:hypothetical protein